MFNRKYIFNPGPFSIAMLVYRSVPTLIGNFHLGVFTTQSPLTTGEMIISCPGPNKHLPRWNLWMFEWSKHLIKLPIPSLKLTNRTWKWMPPGRCHVSFREGRSWTLEQSRTQGNHLVHPYNFPPIENKKQKRHVHADGLLKVPIILDECCREKLKRKQTWWIFLHKLFHVYIIIYV